MRIAIDFDGTIVKQVLYPSIKYEFMPDAETVIRTLALKHTLILNTARYGWYRIPALIFIKRRHLPIQVPIFNKKCVADIYIDDHNLYCKGIDWLEIEKEIDNE